MQLASYGLLISINSECSEVRHCEFLTVSLDVHMKPEHVCEWGTVHAVPAVRELLKGVIQVLNTCVF